MELFHEDEFLNVFKKTRKYKLRILKTIVITLGIILGVFLVGLFVVAHLKLTGRL